MKIFRYCVMLGLVLAAWNEASAYQYVYGIDVSKWQGSINWSAVKNVDQKDFAFIKATEGYGYTDPKFTAYIQGAHNAGLYAGAYHFARPDLNSTISGAINEADWFVNSISPYLTDGYLPPVLDLEVKGSLNKSALTDWTNAFMKRVKERTGLDPIIYCSSNYARNYLYSSVNQWDLWIANWTLNPYGTPPSLGVWNDWEFWQYSNQMSLQGISGRVDGNAFKGTLADLARYAIPEPMTLTLLGLGGLTLIRRKR